MPRSSIWFLAGFSGLIMASPALAHLHVFVDAQIAPQFAADGRIEAIKVTWSYDDLYSLMILEDHALDQDGDDLLTEAEIAGLQGFDSDWPEDFPGNTYVLVAGQPQALGCPTAWTASCGDGKLTSTHMRQLAEPLRPEAAAVVVKNYDPEHYYAYAILAAAPEVQAAGCAAQITPYDPVAADAALSAASDAFIAADTSEPPAPQIGAYFSDRVEVLCAQG